MAGKRKFGDAIGVNAQGGSPSKVRDFSTCPKVHDYEYKRVLALQRRKSDEIKYKTAATDRNKLKTIVIHEVAEENEDLPPRKTRVTKLKKLSLANLECIRELGMTIFQRKIAFLIS